jgi:ubiquinone biosynthesis protein COQ4
LFGPLRLSSKQRRRLYDAHVPWATTQGRACTQSMLSVYYERCFEEDIDELRRRLGVSVAPPLGTSSPKASSA